MKEQQVLRSLAAIAHTNRLNVFSILVTVGPEGMTPGALGDMLEVPAATLSFHLKELNNAGLVTHERCGRNLVYRVDFQHINALVSYLTENCCQGKVSVPQEQAANAC
jgi:ArsR family transcriptional regulator, arsenate/arsenite/antimonite-responsive transcriptional repressor